MLERQQPQNATRSISMSSTNVLIAHTQSTTRKSSPSALTRSKMQALNLYGQASIPTGIKYVGIHQLQGMTFLIQHLPPTIPEPTKGTRIYFNHHNILILSIILRTRTIPLYSTHLGNETTLLSRPSFLP